ncbi:MAG: hypothetical protein QM668_08090 [Agriterribacter sp.]
MQPAYSGATTNVPNYGKLLMVVQEEVMRWADIRCKESLNSQFSAKLEKERGKVKVKTEYLVVANITVKNDCKIEIFRPLYPNENPAVLHDDKTTYLVYTIEVYPWIEYKGKRY